MVPKLTGEIILQYYNSVISLSHLYDYSDGMFLFENDKAENVCKNVMQEKSVGMDSLNFVLGRCISGSLLSGRQSERPSTLLSDVGNFLVPLPSLKLLGARFLPLVPDSLKGF